MDTQDDLLNDAGDVAVQSPPLTAPKPANLTQTKVSNDEVYLGLLHTEIKCRATVPIDPCFEAMPRAPYRPFQLCLPAGFKACALAFFKLFFTDAMFNIMVQHTNQNAVQKEARTSRDREGRRWHLIDNHELSVWIALHIYIGLGNNSNIKSYWPTDKFSIHRPMQNTVY